MGISYLLVAIVVGLMLGLYELIRRWTSPIAKLPGPWHTRWTGLVLLYHRIRGKRMFFVQKLHENYGPCVRVSPHEVHINDVDAAKTVYDFRETFLKTQWYLDETGQQESLFSTHTVELHRRYRKLLSGAMSDSSLATKHMPHIRRKAQLAVQKMGQEMDLRGAADVLKWWLFMATDIIGDLTFGDSFRLLEQGKKNEYVEDMEHISFATLILSMLPRWFPLFLTLQVPVIGRALRGFLRFEGYAKESMQRYRNLYVVDPTKVQQTLFTKAFQALDEGALSIRELVDNAIAYIIAGTDTTANTLTYLTWAVCRDPKIKERLVEELSTLPEAFDDAQLRSLPYLNHVINESLRLYSAAPSALPRRVPEGGAKLCGYWLPAGTTVNAQAYSMHRTPEVWSSPEVFDPLRWEETTQAMQDSFVPFGMGARNCIGQHLARMELRSAVAYFFRAFPTARVSNLEGMCDGDMEQKEYFLMSISGGRCLIEGA